MTEGALQGEERHVVVAGDLEGRVRVFQRVDVGRKRPVDEAFVRAALEPDSRIDATFHQDRMIVVGNRFYVSGEYSERCIPRLLPSRIISVKRKTSR